MSELVTIAEFSKLVPGRPNPTTVWRWARKGIQARNGQRVRLPHQRIGRRLFVDVDAAKPFFQAIADQDVAYFQCKDAITPAEIATPRTDNQRQEDAARAAARLEREGL